MTTPIHDEGGIQTAYGGDAAARDYVGRRFVTELTRLLHDRQVGAVQRVMDRVRPRQTLEIAPGPGRVTRGLNVRGRLVCLDYNEGMVRHGRAACPGAVEWVRGNGFRLPFDQVFDLVYTFRFVRHFQSPDRRRLYTEIRRVLRPGGYFVMDAVNEHASKPLREAHPEEYPIYDVLYRPVQLREELRAVGLEPVSLEPVQKCLRWQSYSQRLLAPRAGWLNRMIVRGLERLPRRDGLEWVVTCRRV